ncbi:hypothetical protein FQA39_LY11481 [Lamprigera yunnana]|nr:hypothetical protein FQA39_LY11481 [Lamprigera yunnana]
MYFQTFVMMWKRRQIGSKTLTFGMIEEKQILRIEDMCKNEVYLGCVELVLGLSYSSGSNFKHFYEDVISAVWIKAIDVKLAVERLYDEPSALEFDDEHGSINGLTIQMCYRWCLLHRLTEVGLQHFLDTIKKYSDSDTTSSDEEKSKSVEQTGEDSETTEEESKIEDYAKMQELLKQFHNLEMDARVLSTKFDILFSTEYSSQMANKYSIGQKILLTITSPLDLSVSINKSLFFLA